jgi:hypothetical protein
MKAWLVVSLGLLWTPFAAWGQPVPVPEDQVPKLPDIDGKVLAEKFDKEAFVDRLRAKFAQIDSYGFSYHNNTPKDPGYFVEWWREAGDAYYYEYDEPWEHMHNRLSFDGVRTSVMRVDSNDVWISKGESPAGKPKAGWQSPLEIYAFLNRDAQFLSLHRLAPDSSLWKDLAGRIDYAGTATFLDRDCIVLRFWGAFDEAKEKAATYDVYFDTATTTPLGWQAYDEKKYMIDEVALVSLQPFAENGDSGPLPFQPHYKHTQYQWQGTLSEGGKIIPYSRGSSDESFDDVEINTIKPADLLLDVSQAKAMIDGDTQKVVWLKP